MSDKQWTPQFPDGSGWNLDDPEAPYFYEHISRNDAQGEADKGEEALWRVVTIVPLTHQYHRNTHFLRGTWTLVQFCRELEGCAEYVVGIEKVSSIPPFDRKLTLDDSLTEQYVCRICGKPIRFKRRPRLFLCSEHLAEHRRANKARSERDRYQARHTHS